ncbi:hypothetical protein [Mycolicibacter algericus]|uniref:hypothetical protein n=1 Tax=Mycolicibacter algericus TaxID=1288388 RepID=UPI003C779A17
MVRGTALVGTPGEVIDQIAVWRDCGVRYIVLANLSALQRSLRNGLTAVVPFHRIVRGIKKL